MASSNAQMAAFSIYATGAGTALVYAPSTLMSILSPITTAVEYLTGLVSRNPT